MTVTRFKTYVYVFLCYIIMKQFINRCIQNKMCPGSLQELDMIECKKKKYFASQSFRKSGTISEKGKKDDWKLEIMSCRGIEGAGDILPWENTIEEYKSIGQTSVKQKTETRSLIHSAGWTIICLRYRKTDWYRKYKPNGKDGQ